MDVVTLAAEGGGQSNFLLPNGTFFVELLLFVIVFIIFTKWIVPPLAKSMQERQDMVRKQAEDREEAVQQLKLAQEKYETALAEARTEAAKIRDEARADAQKIRDEMRADTDREVARIHQQGEEQLAAQRDETVRALRAEIGGLSTDLAGRILGAPLPAEGAHRSTVEQFLADLEQKQNAGGTR